MLSINNKISKIIGLGLLDKLKTKYSILWLEYFITPGIDICKLSRVSFDYLAVFFSLFRLEGMKRERRPVICMLTP